MFAPDVKGQLAYLGLMERRSTSVARPAREPEIFVGETRKRSFIAALREHSIGRIFTVSVPTPYDGERFAIDCGAYSDYLQGRPFRERRYRDYIDRIHTAGLVPAMNVVPDIVGKGRRSLEFSLEWIEKLPQEWPNYLVCQNGMTCPEVAAYMDKFAGVFLGGDDAWKRTAGSWATMATLVGKRFHYGRAGTLKKIRAAKRCNADSLDSSFPLWTQERFDTFIHWVTSSDPQGGLFSR